MNTCIWMQWGSLFTKSGTIFIYLFVWFFYLFLWMCEAVAVTAYTGSVGSFCSVWNRFSWELQELPGALWMPDVAESFWCDQQYLSTAAGSWLPAGWEGGSCAQLRQEEQVNLSITVLGFWNCKGFPQLLMCSWYEQENKRKKKKTLSLLALCQQTVSFNFLSMSIFKFLCFPYT